MSNLKITLFGPDKLTSYDKTEIHKYLDAVIHEHDISVLAYRSIEKEVLKYFAENESYIPQLTIYTFPEQRNLPPNIQASINFFLERGATHKTFYHNEAVVTRSVYCDAWRYIMDENDAVVTFFDEEIHMDQRKKLMIPIDIAAAAKKKAFFHALPVHKSNLLQRKAIDKIRQVR